MPRRRSIRISFGKKTEEAKTVAATFLSEHEKLQRLATSNAVLYVGHITPNASFPEGLKLDEYMEWLLELCKDNMEELYDDVWGWDDHEKLQQFRLDRSHFFVVFEDDMLMRPIGFCQVVLEWYEGRLVLYMYEMQIMEGWRQKGIGKWLMTIAEALANKLEVKSLVLTCMKQNRSGMEFYKKCGFGIDSSSPDSGMAEKYEILSKELTHPKLRNI